MIAQSGTLIEFFPRSCFDFFFEKTEVKNDCFSEITSFHYVSSFLSSNHAQITIQFLTKKKVLLSFTFFLIMMTDLSVLLAQQAFSLDTVYLSY